MSGSNAMRKVVINKCYGGFGLSQAAYEKLIEWGVPVVQHAEDAPKTGVIFDQELSAEKRGFLGRYWEGWLRNSREHSLLVRVVEELGPEIASGRFAKLKVVEVPGDVEYEIDEYDGIERIAEKHRTWE